MTSTAADQPTPEQAEARRLAAELGLDTMEEYERARLLGDAGDCDGLSEKHLEALRAIGAYDGYDSDEEPAANDSIRELQRFGYADFNQSGRGRGRYRITVQGRERLLAWEAGRYADFLLERAKFDAAMAAYHPGAEE